MAGGAFPIEIEPCHLGLSEFLHTGWSRCYEPDCSTFGRQAHLERQESAAFPFQHDEIEHLAFACRVARKPERVTVFEFASFDGQLVERLNDAPTAGDFLWLV